MASTTLAHVDNFVMRFSKATFRERELLKSISILSIENMKSSMAFFEKDIPKGEMTEEERVNTGRCSRRAEPPPSPPARKMPHTALGGS
jgi:hypothetical protein